jgi:hypothetical protein
LRNSFYPAATKSLLDSVGNRITFASMKRLVNWIIVLALAGSLVSCGLPGAAVRTASNTVKSVAGMAKKAANSASAL